MRTFAQVFLPFVALVAYVVTLEAIPNGGLVSMIAVGTGAMVAAVVGPRLHLSLRLFITAIIFEFGYSMCLVGRTMGPGFTGTNVGWALLYFAILATGPFSSLLRLWDGRVSVILLVAALPASLVLAASVATFEEYRFVRLHRDSGIGPTARWTVSNHWLSYDAKEQRLYGSD